MQALAKFAESANEILEKLFETAKQKVRANEPSEHIDLGKSTERQVKKANNTGPGWTAAVPCIQGHVDDSGGGGDEDVDLMAGYKEQEQAARRCCCRTSWRARWRPSRCNKQNGLYRSQQGWV
ncbi:hypothetical protein ABZP36_002113 [Zizania latifolia]